MMTLSFLRWNLLFFWCGFLAFLSQPSVAGSRLPHPNKIPHPQVPFELAEQARTRLATNYRSELHDALNKRARDAVVRKYQILSQELEEQIIRFHGSHSAVAAESEFEPADADVLARLTASYHPLALAAVKKVFSDLGDLYANVTKDASGSINFVDIKVDRPWSGYWYPFYDRSLYEGEQAPLRKFDRMLASLGKPDTNIALSEGAKYTGFHPDSWEGFCDGWAIASILTKEPSQVIQVGETKFSIADQKALAVFAHIAYPYTTYGLKYLGDASSDGTYQDIYPEGFHRLITRVLGEEKLPLIIDETPGVQVWNKPVFRYRYKIEQDPQKDYALLVTAYPWLVKERWQISDSPTTMNDVIAPVYHYRLFVDKKQIRDGQFKVIAGEWIDESYDNHPGSVKYVKAGQMPRSANEVFNKYIDSYVQTFLKRL